MPSGRTLSLSFPPFTRAVKWLIIINAAVYLLITLLQVFTPDLGSGAVHLLGLAPYLVTHGAIWQLVTYSFVHAGLFHLLFNMLALWMFGAQFEQDWGHKQF